MISPQNPFKKMALASKLAEVAVYGKLACPLYLLSWMRPISPWGEEHDIPILFSKKTNRCFFAIFRRVAGLSDRSRCQGSPTLPPAHPPPYPSPDVPPDLRCPCASGQGTVFGPTVRAFLTAQGASVSGKKICFIAPPSSTSE